MNLIKSCRIHCLSENLSPMTHMMGTAGNEAIIMREQVYSGGKLRGVPAISGNAIRHRAIREPGALYLIKQCGLLGKLTIDQANYLLNGGSLTESSVSENLARIAEMQELLPLIRLLGGSLRNQVVGGSLFVMRGILVCEENRETILKYLPNEYTLPAQALRPAETFVDQYQYTRGDARRRHDSAQLLETPDIDGTNLMIYSGQAVVAGAMWYHGFVLQNVSPLEVGALLHALEQWQGLGGTLGGQARIGHGKLRTEIFFEDGEDFFGSELNPAGVVEGYIEHVGANAANIVSWLNSAFPAKGKKLL
ncbi:MAG: hypothetical protein WAX33_04365 [Rectinemataceae bacterium]